MGKRRVQALSTRSGSTTAELPARFKDLRKDEVTMKDTIVVGGGIIGCSIALRLAQAGQRVAVIDRASAGSEASSAAAGMLSTQTDAVSRDPFFDLGLKSRNMYKAFAQELKDLSGVDPEYQSQGTICVALNNDEMEHIAASASWQIESGFAVERLSANDIARLEPEVSRSAVGGLFFPEDHQVENRRLMTALAGAVRKLGVELIEQTEVTALALEGNACTGVETAGQSWTAGSVVIAAGSWSEKFLAPIGIKIGIAPVRGQMLALRGDVLPISHVVHSGSCYLVPRKDGRIVVGSTIEQAGFEKSVTAGGVSHLLDDAVRLVPALGEARVVELWSGLRPDTPDHLPVFGPTPIENLYLASGHYRNGIMLAPITAEIMRDCVLNKTGLPEEFAAFGLSRFGY